jgi:putative protease
VAEIKLEAGNLNRDDTILIIGPTTGVTEHKVGEIRVDLKETEKALKGELCSVKIPDYLRRSDRIYKWISREDPGRE